MKTRHLVRQHGWTEVKVKLGDRPGHSSDYTEQMKLIRGKHREIIDWCVAGITPSEYTSLFNANGEGRYFFKNPADATMFTLVWKT